jgi:hypothetical protein
MNKLGLWFSGYTLVDVTDTGIRRYQQELHLKRNQQRNWETVLQVIGLRAQPVDLVGARNPKMVSMQTHNFGSYYRGSQRCWKFMFFIEHNEVFGPEEDPTRFLIQDFDEVPIITGLEETAAFPDPVFYTEGILKNLYFRVSFETE